MKDPIERQMAIDALHVWFNINMVTEKDMSDHIHDLELIINHIIGLQKVALRKLPSAQPEQYWIDSEGNVSTLPSAQKTGKWIPWKYHDGFRCEYCNEPVDNKHNFCPNCGADMRGDTRHG